MNGTLHLNNRKRVFIREGRPAPISDQLKGKSIERLLSTETQLLIRCTDGTEVRISWRNEQGLMVGVPYLDDVGRFK